VDIHGNTKEVVKELRLALYSIGFVYIRSRKLPEEDIKSALKQTEWFFNQSLQLKQSVGSHGGNPFGYNIFKGVGEYNITKTESILSNDRIEAFLIGNDKSDQMTLKKSLLSKIRSG